MPFISLHSKVPLLPPSIFFAWFLLFCSSCIISHLQNFWRGRILLINLNNKGRQLWETCRQPFHRLNWRCLGCLCQWRFNFLQPAEKPCALNTVLKHWQSKNQVYKPQTAKRKSTKTVVNYGSTHCEHVLWWIPGTFKQMALLRSPLRASVMSPLARSVHSTEVVHSQSQHGLDANLLGQILPRSSSGRQPKDRGRQTLPVFCASGK